MDHWSILLLWTIVFFSLVWIGFCRTKDPTFVVGSILIFYFSLLGSYALVADRIGGDSGFTYQYLEDKLFPVYLDYSYRMTIHYYGLFICLAILPMVLFGQSRKILDFKLELNWNAPRGLMLALVSAVLSVWIMRDYLIQAIFLNLSGYAATRGQLGVDSLFTLHQILNRVALFSLAAGLVLIDRKDRLWRIPYGIFFVFMAAFCAILGNKNELLQSFILIALLWQCTHPKTSVVYYLPPSIFAILSLGLVNFVRTLPLSGLQSGLREVDLWNSFRSMFISNEAIGPHLAMYNTLLHDIPPSGGTSISSLLLSIVPRFFWADRPGSIYEYYVAHLGVVDRQGFGIHHAAGWYLNFGVIGIAAGALLLGCLWYYSLCRWQSASKVSSKTLFKFLLYPSFCLFLIEAIRAGPEAYKGFLVNWFLLFIIFRLITAKTISLWNFSIPASRLQK